jgi:hypothetical protein
MRSFLQILVAALALAGCAQLPMSDPVKVRLVGIEPMPGQGLELRMAVKLRGRTRTNRSRLQRCGPRCRLEGLSFASGGSDVWHDSR